MAKMEVDVRKLQELNDLCVMLVERMNDVRFSAHNLSMGPTIGQQQIGVMGGLQHSNPYPQHQTFLPIQHGINQIQPGLVGWQHLPTPTNTIPGQFIQHQPQFLQPYWSTGLSHTTPIIEQDRFMRTFPNAYQQQPVIRVW